MAPAVCGQVLASEADWKAVIKDIAKNSRQIKAVKTQMQSINQQGEQLAGEEESMDSRACESSGGHSEACTTYNSDEAVLEQRRNALLQEWLSDERQLRSLEDQVNSLTARIRASRVLPGLEAWIERLKKCATLPPMDGVACLGAVKEDHP